jgi:YbbR domain-containing protein
MNNDNKNYYSESNSASSEKLFIPKQWFFSRIICLIVAFAIWIYVVNVKTQDYEKTFNLIDVSVEGWEELLEDTNLSVVNLEESKISVTVKGLRGDISKLTPSDFNAYIDVSKLTEGGKHNLEVSVDLPSTVSLVSKYPESVTISIDENIEREIGVEIDVTEYSMDTIYEMGVPECNITTVKVTGPSEVLDRVKSAKAFINLGTVMTSTVIRTELVLIDKAGNSIDTTYLTLDNTSVTVTVPVKMEKTVSLVCTYLPGVSQSLYSSIVISPSTIKVKGDPKILNELDSINVFALDGSGDVTYALAFSELLIPGGVEVINAPSIVKIIAERVEETNEITTPPQTDVNNPESTNSPDEERAASNE